MKAACATVRRQLAWFVGEDLDRGRAAPVARHLAACPDCRREASSLQQSHKALASLAGRAVAGADAEMFAVLHRDTLAAVGREVVAEGNRGPLRAGLARGVWIAAAVMLFALGWWSVRQPESPTLLERGPISPAIAPPTTPGGPQVEPWAGPRARLQPLGFDDNDEMSGDDAAASGIGAGMLRRVSLRTLEDELEPPPRRWR